MTEHDDRFVDPARRADEPAVEQMLRPRRFADYVGQRRLRENLEVFVRAARQRGEALDHVLLSGPPGLGKTTLAHILAREMDVEIHVTTGPALERKKDLAGILTALKPRAILFIDEIHRLNAAVEENLYPAMEDYEFDLIIGEGPHARSFKVSLPPFTLIGATTRMGLLTSPLRSRFGVVARLSYYSTDELKQIVMRSARLLDVAITDEAATELARRARGTPRIANRLLRRARDFAQVEWEGRIDLQVVRHALQRLDIDELGLDPLDHRYLGALVRKFGGGPTGIDTLAAALNEDRGTLEDVCEPFLIQLGLLQRTPRGRVATPRAFAHLGITPPGSGPSDPSRRLL